jgi:hypothetical protein
MEITIERNIKESALAINKMQWQLFLKKHYLWIAYYTTTGTVFIIVNFKGDSPYGLAFGMGLVLFAFLHILNLIRASEKSQDRIKMELAKRSETDPVNRIELNDSKFIQESRDVKMELSWNTFQCYKIYKGSIFLIGGSYLDSFVLRKSDMLDSEFSEISTFISRTLPEKK